MIVFLSPAKSIDTSKRLNTSECSEPIFISEADNLIGKLRKFSVNKIGKLMHLSKDLAQLNHKRYNEWNSSMQLNDKNGHAAAVFNGEAYRGLDATSMNTVELDVAQEKVRIISGIYGILRPLDIIYPYRLEMGTKWAVTASKSNLYKFWGTKIAEAINSENEDGVVVNLASNEYFKAIDKQTLKAKVITPIFKERKNGKYSIIMVYAKKARGLMARYIVDNNISKPAEMKRFNREGYKYDDDQSTENEWVFTR